MSDLLPANATPQERAISEAIARLGAVPSPIRGVWSPADCPAELLPWLAWAFSVDEWSPTWTDEQYRAVIAASIEVHKHKGTIGAVRAALSALGLSVTVLEWWQSVPAGDPYTFRLVIEINQSGYTAQQLETLIKVINDSKNLRSHLEQIQPVVRTVAGPQVAAITVIGNEIELTNYEASP